MKIQYLAFLCAVACYGAVQADTLKGLPGCQSKDVFDQFVTAVQRNDDRGKEYLLKHGCILTIAGTEVSVLHESWGKAEVRAYLRDKDGDYTVTLWTYIENIQTK